MPQWYRGERRKIVDFQKISLYESVAEPARQSNTPDLAVVTQDNLVINVTAGKHLSFYDFKLARVNINAHAGVTEKKMLVPNFKSKCRKNVANADSYVIFKVY